MDAVTDVTGLEVAPSSRRSRRTLLGEPVLRLALVVTSLVLLALIAVVPQVQRQLPFSVFDESTHIDYSWRASHLDFPARGDQIDETVMQIWMCYGNDQLELPSCGTEDPDPNAFSAQALQYNTAHPPTYYVITGLAGRAIDAATPLDLVTSMRLTGAGWLAAGMIMMFAALRVARVPWALSWVLAGVAGMWWPIVAASSIVTNDAPALLTAGTALLIAGAMARGKVPIVWPIALTAVLSSMKVVNGLAPLAVAGLALLMAIFPKLNPKGLHRGRLAIMGSGMIVGTTGLYFAWTRFQAGRGDPDYVSPVLGVNTTEFVGSPIDEWLRTLLDGFSGIGHATVQVGQADRMLEVLVAQVIAIALLAVPFVGAIVSRLGTTASIFALSMLIGLSAWPLIVQLRAYMSSDGTDYFMQPSTRYAITLVGFGVALIGLLAQRFRWTRPVMVIGVAMIAIVLVGILVPGFSDFLN